MQKGTSIKNVSKELEISIPTIRKFKTKFKMNLDNNISVTKDHLNKLKERHGNNKIDPYIEPITKYAKEHDFFTLKDIDNDITKGTLSNSSLSRLIKIAGCSHQRLQTKVINDTKENVDKKRADYVKDIKTDTVLESYYLDEISFDQREYLHYGYREIGKRTDKEIMVKHKHSNRRYSCIAIMSNNSIICKKIIDSTFNQEELKNFFKENTNSLSGKRIIMDNARIHHGKEFKKYIKDETKINIDFIPAYSPVFNPIELLFNKVKCAYRQKDHQNVENDINESFHTITQSDCLNFYNKVIQTINSYKA